MKVWKLRVRWRGGRERRKVGADWTDNELSMKDGNEWKRCVMERVHVCEKQMEQKYEWTENREGG